MNKPPTTTFHTPSLLVCVCMCMCVCVCVCVQAPFRFPRLVIFGGLGFGAAAGLVVILIRLAASLKGECRTLLAA